MDVTREDVLRCARLTCLDLQESEIEPLRAHMQNLLSHAAALDELDLAQLPPTLHGLDLPLLLRPDVPEPSLDHAGVMKNAPDQDRGQFVVPKVLDR